MHHHRRPEEMQTQPSIKQKALEGAVKIHTHTQTADCNSVSQSNVSFSRKILSPSPKI
jgi:hypothetical protein